MGKVVYIVCSAIVFLAIVQQHTTNGALSRQAIATNGALSRQAIATKLVNRQSVAYKPRVVKTTNGELSSKAIAIELVDRLRVAYKPRIVKTSYVKPDGSVGERTETILDPHDIFFVVDTSGSIGKSNFNTMRQFMKTLVESTIIGPQRHHAGVVTFATSSQIRVNYILSTKSHCHFLNEVNKLPYNGGMTNTKGGFSSIKTLIQQSFINRPESKKIVFYLTDGNWNNGGNPNSAINAVKQLGNGDGQVLIFSFGIGNVQESHLKYASTFGLWRRIPTFDKFREVVAAVEARLKVTKLGKNVEFQYDGVSSSDCGYSGGYSRRRLCIHSRCGGCDRCACQISTGSFVCKDLFIGFPYKDSRRRLRIQPVASPLEKYQQT